MENLVHLRDLIILGNEFGGTECKPIKFLITLTQQWLYLDSADSCTLSKYCCTYQSNVMLAKVLLLASMTLLLVLYC